MQKRVLIVRQDRIGDAVVASALPREIKRRWPTSHVAMMVRGYTRPIFENNPHVDEIILADHNPDESRSDFWQQVSLVRKQRFTHALLLLPGSRFSQLTFWAGIPFRIGHGLILHQAITFVRPVLTRKKQKGRSEAEYAMDLARAMGVNPESLNPEIHFNAEEQATGVRRKAAWQGPFERRLIGIHTTNGNSAPNWEYSQWAKLIEILAAEESVQVLVTDHEVPAEVADIPGVFYPNTVGDLRSDLLNFAAMDLLVSSSTGPMHIASAVSVKTLSLFCPMPACEPALWGTIGNEPEFLLPEAEYCRDKCPGDPHDCRFVGSKQLSPEVVARKILATR